MSMEQITVKWNEFGNERPKSLQHLRNKGELLDVTVISSDQVPIPAHRVILAAGSGYFREVLKTAPPLMKLSEITQKEFETLLDFMYTGEMIVSRNELPSVLEAAEKLKVWGLIDEDEIGKGNTKDVNKELQEIDNVGKQKEQLEREKYDETFNIEEIDDTVESQEPYGEGQYNNMGFSEENAHYSDSEHIGDDGEATAQDIPIALNDSILERDKSEDNSVDNSDSDSDEDILTQKQKVEQYLQYETIRNENTNRNKTYWSCKVCGYQNNRKSCVFEHVEIHHKPSRGSYRCIHCPNRYDSKNSLKSHIYRNHGGVWPDDGDF